MVEESKKMVIDTKTRLDKAVEDLQTLIVRNGGLAVNPRNECFIDAPFFFTPDVSQGRV